MPDLKQLTAVAVGLKVSHRWRPGKWTNALGIVESVAPNSFRVTWIDPRGKSTWSDDQSLSSGFIFEGWWAAPAFPHPLEGLSPAFEPIALLPSPKQAPIIPVSDLTFFATSFHPGHCKCGIPKGACTYHKE